MDLTALTVADLLALSAASLAELRRRGVVRTGNAPLGDYAEWLAARALGGVLVANSVKSYDLISADGRRVQVKARRVSEPVRRGELQTSPFRSWDFDDALLVLVDAESYVVRRGALVPVEIVRDRSTYRAHVNGSIAFMDDPLMGHPAATDVTAQLRHASLA